jgi:hypothetical protein
VEAGFVSGCLKGKARRERVGDIWKHEVSSGAGLSPMESTRGLSEEEEWLTGTGEAGN